MNKVILSAFVLLLVAQGIESQFPILNFVGTLIVNLLTVPLAITSSFVSTLAYNVLSFTGFSLNWQYSQSDFLVYVKPPAVICSSTMSTSTIQLVSPTLKNLITSINSTVYGIDANVATFTSTLNNKSYSNCGRNLASLVVNLYDQVPRRLGYSLISIGTVMGGRRPNQSPFGLTPYDPVYPVPSTILPRDTDNFRAAVGVQAKNFILYLPYLFKDLNDASAAYQNLRGQIRGGCVCPSSTTVSNIIAQWTSLNTSIAGFTASTATTKTLVQVLGSAILTNVTATFNATSTWMNSILSCTQCLIGSLKNNGSRCVKFYCNDKPQNDSISAGFNDTACTISGLRAIDRFRNNLKLDYVLARNVELRAQSFLLSRVSRYVSDHSGCVGKGIINVNKNTGLLRNSIFKKRMKIFKGHMDSFQVNIQNSYNGLGLNINNSIAAFNSFIDSTIQNSTAMVSSSAVTFAESVINSSSLYPCCQQYAGQALDIQDIFQGDVKSCMQNTATAVNNIVASMTTDLTSHGKNFNRFTSTVDSCINTYCKKWTCVNAFLLIPSFDTHVSNCVTAVNTGLIGYNPNVFTIGNSSIASVAANIATANVTFNQCINIAVSKAQQSLLTVQNQYSTCKQVGTCINGTTDMRPTLGPVINLIFANLTALLGYKGNTSIEPECLSAVMSDATFLMDQTKALNSSMMTQTYETEEKVLTFIMTSLAAVNHNFSLCKSDNRTILLPRIEQAITDLSNLWNLTMNVTGLNPECLNMSQQNISGVIEMALSLETQLNVTDYVVDFAAVDALPSIIEQLRAEFNVCMNTPYDNRTALIPNITQIVLDLQTMINITLNSSMDPICGVPLLDNLTSVLSIADSLSSLIFTLPYDVDVQIVAGAQNLTIELQNALTACQVFDNRTLLLPDINQVINDINNLLNLTGSSTGDPACLASLTANMTAVLNVSLDLQVSLTDYTYDIGLGIVGELQLVMAEFQASYNACLIYDNRSALAADVNNILASVTALSNLIANSTASSYCLGPLQQNVSILTNVSIMIQTDIYNFTYDIGLTIVTEMQAFLAQLQASYDACLLFDERTLLQPEITADSASLNAFANILMTSTAHPYCLDPIKQNLSVLLTMQSAIESGLFNSSYAAALTIMINFDASFAQLQAAYNTCLTFDNRTLLVPTINTIVTNLTALASLITNSTASPYCLLPLQANLTILLNISASISTDIFNYSYEIGAAIISGFELSLAQAQDAYAACLTFDNRTLLETELTGDLANLTIFANILSSSTADPYCLGPIQQNFSLLMSVAVAIQSGLYNSTYYTNMIGLMDLDSAFAKIQAAYAACLTFDNRTLLTPSVTTVLSDLTALNSLLANSTTHPYCKGPLQANLSVLMIASASLQVDIFNYTYEIGAAIIAGFQMSIAEAQAAYNACLLFDNRTLLQQELTVDLSNLTTLANLIMSSTAAPYCLTPIQQNLSVIQSISQVLQSGLFSSSYSEGLTNMMNLDTAVAQLQAAFDACLLFDNRTLIASDLPGIMSSIASVSAQVSSAVADPACLGPIQANLTLVLNISQSLQTELFNYTYEIGLAMIGSLQMAISDAQAELATCLADPRIPMITVISDSTANATTLINLLANSTASSYCLLPLQQNVSMLMNISQSFQQDFYSYDYEIGSTILSGLQSSLAEAQAAYEECLVFDNRTLLQTELTGDLSNLTALINTIMSSTADPYCLTAIQQNASSILAIAQAIQAGLFGNSYFQGLMNMQSLDVAVEQLQAAYDACLLFDNRTLLLPSVADLQANLTALANLAVNSTADQYCLGPLQNNLTMLISMTSNLQVDIFNYSYEIANWILNDFQVSLALEQANYINCSAFDNRTLLQPNVTAALNDLTALSNTIMTSTADPYCLTAIQQNMSIILSGAVTFSSELFNNSYELDLNVLLSIQSALIDIQAAYNACLLFDNRTLLVPTVEALQANLTALANLAANSSADQYCLGPLQYNLTMLVSMTSNLQVDIFNFSYEIANWILNDFEATLAMEQATYAACLLFDNRTLLQSELIGDLSNLTAFNNLIMSSSADPYCLSAIQQNMTILYNFAQAMQSGLFNYSYSTNEAVMAEIDATFANLQIAYTACLNFDNRTLLVPIASSVLANLTALATIAINSTADPYCLGPIQQNLSILVGFSATLEVDIFNYTYDIAATIIADIQASIAMEQAAYDACLTFDNRTLLQPEITADSASLNAFANILMTSAANPYCLDPIKQNLSSLLTLSMAIESGLFNSSYAAALTLMINFDASFAQLQAAYNTCLTFDNRTLLVPTINSLLTDLASLTATVSNSTADTICLGSLQANLTTLSIISASLPTDIFNYTYEIGHSIISDLQTSLAQAQEALTACETFDSRNLLIPNVTSDLATLNALSSLIMNSTADPTCLGPIQQNLSIVINASQLLPTMIFNYTYEIGLSMITSLEASIVELQAAYDACLNFDNRTLLVPTITTAVASINNILALIPTSNGSLACMTELQQNLTLLLNTSASLQIDIFNYTYEISAAIVLDLQQSIASAQAQLTTCQIYDPRSEFFAVSSAVSSNLSAIASDILSIPSTAPCLAAVQQAMALLNNASASFNESILVVTYNTSQTNAASLTQAMLDLQAADAACRNYDNRTEFMGSNLILASNVSDLMNVISSSSALSVCVNPILQDAVWLLGNITAFNATVLSSSYANDLSTSNILYATFSAIQAQWSACLVYTTTTTTTTITMAPVTTAAPVTTLAPVTTIAPTTVLPTTKTYPANTTTDPRASLNTTLVSATATLNDLLGQVQSFTGNQTGIPGFTAAINDLLSQIQNLEANLMNNNYTMDAALVSAIQTAVAQQVADWAAYVASSSATTTVDPRLALLTEAQNLATVIAGLTQEMQNYNGSQTGISTFLGLTGDLAAQVQSLIDNMMNNTYTVDAALLATLQNAVAQDAAAWTVYKSSETAPTTSATSTSELTTAAQTLLADLNTLVQSMQSYTGNQTGIPGFVADTTGLTAMVQALITNMGNNTLAEDIAALTALQNAAAQQATAWAAYVAGSTLSSSTATTTIDTRTALTNSAQQLLVELQTLLQTIQNYTGNQTGVPVFITNTSSLIAQVQDLITNMMNNPASVDATILSNLDNLALQESMAWAFYVANDVIITTIDPRLALLTEAQNLATVLAGLTQEMQNYNGSQTGIPTFLGLTGDLAAQVQSLIDNMMNNTYTVDAALLATLQNAVAQNAAIWAAYKASDTTTTSAATSTTELTITAQTLLADLNTLLQNIQNYSGNQTGVPGFVTDTTGLITMLQASIDNMGNNTLENGITALTALQNAVSQEATAWAAYIASDISGTSSTITTVDPRLALLAEAQSLLANLTALTQDMQAFTGDQTGVPTFLGLTGDLTSQVQNFINSIMSNDYATDAAMLSNLQNFVAQDTSAWTAYKDSNTAPTAAATSTADLTTIAQTLLSDLNSLLSNMLNYAGNQTGVPGFVGDTSNLISQLESLIASFGTNGLPADISALTALQNQVAQEATAWAAYVSGNISELLTTTTTTTTADPRLALLADAQGLQTVLDVLIQEMQNYNGSQTGIPTFLGLTGDLAAQVQNLIDNMMNNTYATDAALLSNLQNLVTQAADAWAVYKASNTAPTTAATSPSELTTIAQGLLDSVNLLLQDMQNYTGNQTGVPGFLAETNTIISELQNLMAILGNNSLSTEIAVLSAIQNAAEDNAVAWAAYVAGNTLSSSTATTTIDTRPALTNSAQQLLAELQTLLQTIQNYTGNQTGVPEFITNTSSLIAQVQDLITNMMNNPASVDATILSNLDNLALQESMAWALYVANDTTASTIQTTTQAPTDNSNSTTTTTDPRLALLSTSQILASNLAALNQDMLTYTGNQAGVPTFTSLTGTLATQLQDLTNNMMNNNYTTDAALLNNLQLLSSQDAAAWIAYKSSDTAVTAAATSTEALNATVESTVNDLNVLLQSMQNYAANQAVVPTSVSDTISNIQNLITQGQNLSASLGTNGLTADISAVTALQNQVSQAATGWAEYIGNIVSASAPTTVSTTTAASNTDATTVSLNVTTLAPVTLNTSDTTISSSDATTINPVDLNTTIMATVAPTDVITSTILVTTIPTIAIPTTAVPTTETPTTAVPTTEIPTTEIPTTLPPTTLAPTTLAPTTLAPTTLAPTTLAPTTTTSVITTTTSKTYPLTTVAGQCGWCFKIPLLTWAQLLISFKSTSCTCPTGYVVMRNWTDLIFGAQHSCCY